MTPARRAPGVLHTLGVRMAAHSSIYIAGAALTAVYGLIQIAVLTRVLPIGGFGQLAVLIAYSGLITALCNLGFVTGTMLTLPYVGGGAGGGGDDDDDGGDVEEDMHAKQPAGDPRALVGTGVAIALLLTAAVTALSVVFAHPLADLLGDQDQPTAVIWATAAGGLGALWRIVTAVPRYDRRPARYVAMQAAYWAIALCSATALARAGYGVGGAMAGIALGHVGACIIGLWLARHRFHVAFQPSGVKQLGRRGLPYAGLSLPAFVGRHADLYVLALYVPHRDLALYTVATRFTRMPALAATGAVLAFGPLARGPMRAALERDRAGDWARSRIVNYYVVLAAFNVVLLAVWAPVIVGIVPRGYAGAAVLIQLFALVAALHGFQGVLYRMTRFPQKIKQMRRIVWASAMLTIIVALLLTPTYGVHGAIVSAAVAPAIGVPTLLLLSQRGATPLPLSASHLLRCIALMVLALAVAFASRPLPHEHEVVIGVLVTLAFPVLVVVSGALPRNELVRLLRLPNSMLTSRAERRRLRAAVRDLSADDRALLETLAVRREEPEAVARQAGMSEREMRRRFVTLLRELGPVGTPAPGDDRLGAVLLSPAPRIDRENEAVKLAIGGHVDPLDVEHLLTLEDRIRRLPAAIWNPGRERPASSRGWRPAAPRE